MSYKYVKNLGRNSSSRASYGYGSGIDGITVHHWGSTGQKHANVVSWLRGYTGNRGSSAHYVVSAGLVTQLVEDSRASWHGGNNKANGTTIGIEMRPEMTDGDWETLVELCVNIERKHGSMKYYGHKDWKNTACPGDYYDRLGELVDAVNAYKKTGKVPSTTGGGSSSGGSTGGASKSYTTVAYGTTLGKYDKGNPVKDWQDFLVDQGYSLGKGGVDRFFGASTVTATKKYQKKAGLTGKDVDGMAGKDTWALAKKDGFKWKRKPKAGSKPTPGKAKAFPWGKGHYIGPKSGPTRSHSGFYGNDATHIKALVDQLAERGWDPTGDYLVRFGNDGKYGAELQSLIIAFQKDQGLAVDGLAGREVWDAAFTNPVT